MIREKTLPWIEEASRFQSLNDWFLTGQGQMAARAFLLELSKIDIPLYGEALMQLGCCGNNPWLSALRYRYKWFLSPSLESTTASVVSSLTRMPIDRNSIDCILAPLTLEAFTHQKHPLDEIDRILKPQGRVIFFGINPFSFWGLALKSGRLRCYGELSGQLFSPIWLKHAFIHRGYDITYLSHFHYIPPITSDRYLSKWEFLNQFSKMIAPFPSSFYCLIAEKQVIQPLPMQFSGAYEAISASY
jgi:SAM-dependent methyltransferase